MAIDYYRIGTIGLINLSILTAITLIRFIKWYRQWELPETWRHPIFRKRFCFHLLLLLASLVDLPMYISFVLVGDYTLASYAFHKFESASLFAALSITISDWSTVLHDIHEYDLAHFFLRKYSLITINLIYFTISFINFIFCFTLDNLGAYLGTPIYVTGIFFQISVSILLTGLMLHAGLKLYGRISGAAGNNMTGSESTPGGVSHSTRLKIPSQFFKRGIMGTPSMSQSTTATTAYNGQTNTTTPGTVATTHMDDRDVEKNIDLSMGFMSGNLSSTHSSTLASIIKPRPTEEENHFDGTAEFRNALRNLNLVMAACTLCVLLEMIMLILNYALGYADSADKTPGPVIFYWTCYAWIPLWGPILALLYLSRSQSSRKRKQQQFSTGRMMESLESSQGQGSVLGAFGTVGGPSGAVGTNSRTSTDYYNHNSVGDYEDSVNSGRKNALMTSRFISHISEDGDLDTVNALHNDPEVARHLQHGVMRTPQHGEDASDHTEEFYAVTVVPGTGQNVVRTSESTMSTTNTFRLSSQSNSQQQSQQIRLSQQKPGDNQYQPPKYPASAQRPSSLYAMPGEEPTPSSQYVHHNSPFYIPGVTDNEEYDEMYGNSTISQNETMRIIMGTSGRRDGHHGGNNGQERTDSQDGSTMSPFSPDSSMNFLYRDTTATNLPSELFFPRLHSGDHQADFSYRGEEVHNGQYR